MVVEFFCKVVTMERKEEIILASLELASQNGLSAVSMSQIAQKVGIKKASFYNHFSSKEEIINQMYVYLRNQAQTRNSITIRSTYGTLFKEFRERTCS